MATILQPFGLDVSIKVAKRKTNEDTKQPSSAEPQSSDKKPSTQSDVPSSSGELP